MVLAFLSAALALSSPGLQTDTGQFPDNGENHWAYEGLARLKSLSLWVGYPDGLGVRVSTISRYEFAVAFHATAFNLSRSSEGVEAEFRQVERTPRGTPQTERMLGELAQERKDFEIFASPDVTQILLHAKTEFAPELRALGVTKDVFAPAVEEAKFTFAHWRTPIAGIALQQFKDVPTIGLQMQSRTSARRDSSTAFRTALLRATHRTVGPIGEADLR